MSTLISKILSNSYTRIMFVIYLLIIGMSTFFLLFGYYDQLALHEKAQYDKLKAAVSSIAMEMDGDAIAEMMDEYGKMDEIEDLDQDDTYYMYNQIMSRAVEYNEINSPMYTLTYDAKKDVFLYGIRSDESLYYRHEYVEYPDVLLSKMKEGGVIPKYETENGVWLSAFHPIRSSNGEVIGILEADEDFSSFISEVRWQYITEAIGTLFIIVLLAFFLVLYARKILAAEEEQKLFLVTQKKIIEQKNQSINDSINYALKIQSSLLPAEDRFEHHFTDYFLFYRPKDIVSGDFYWMEKIGNEVFVAVADCTGHGVPGAMVSVVCSNALNRVVKEMRVKQTGTILDKVADIVSDRFSQGGMNDGMDISFCRINLETHELEYSGANNPIYIVSKGELQIFPSSRQPIGQYVSRKSFDSTIYQLKAGDAIYLFSDGFPDQFGGVEGKKFKYKPFRELLEKVSESSMDQQNELIELAFDEWKGDLEQVDDVCVLGIRV